MITKIELIENNMLEKKYVIEKERISIYHNFNLVYQNVISNFNDFINLINTYTLLWEQKYISNSGIDGLKSVLIIYTEKEKIEYEFVNSFPDNYDFFIEKFNNLIGDDYE